MALLHRQELSTQIEAKEIEVAVEDDLEEAKDSVEDETSSLIIDLTEHIPHGHTQLLISSLLLLELAQSIKFITIRPFIAAF